MSKLVNGGPRTKNARETYVEQLPYGRGLTPCMNKKRKPFTHLNSPGETDFAFLSTPDYLRQMTGQDLSLPTELILARNVPRTKSASEMTPRNNLNRSMAGNPKYKAQEDYYDDIQALKKEMKTVKDENSNLRAKIRRLEEDNARKLKEIDALYDTNKDGDLRRTLSGPSTDRNNNLSAANVVMSLKQRVFKLELQVKQKETAIEELRSDPKWTRSTELEIQNRALFNEVERQKVERLNYIHQNDYGASVDEEKKNAVRKLNTEKENLKKENESLKKKLHDFDKLERGEQVSARPSNDRNDKDLQRKVEYLQRDCDNYEEELTRIKDELKQMRRQRDDFRDKLEQASENLEATHHDRDKHGRLNTSGRSSPVPKREEMSPKPLRASSINRSSNLQFGPREPSPTAKIPVKTSVKNIRRNEWTKEDDNRVKNFREKRAATVIQRGWRDHERSRDKKKGKLQSPRQSSSKLSSTTRPADIRSPRASSSSFRDVTKSRPTSADNSNEAALKTVQASLRGYLNRSDAGKGGSQTPVSPRSRSPATMNTSKRMGSDDEDDIGPLVGSRSKLQTERNEKARESSFNPPKLNSRQSLLNDKTGSKNQLSSNSQDLGTQKFRPVSPPRSYNSPLSPPQTGASGGGSKRSLPNDRIKMDAGNRFSPVDRELIPKQRRTPSPPTISSRPSSPHVGGGGSGSKQNLPIDRLKLDSNPRIRPNERDSAPKLQRPSSPTTVQRPKSPSIRDPRSSPSPSQSSRKSPNTSKHSIKNISNDDDDDVVG